MGSRWCQHAFKNGVSLFSWILYYKISEFLQDTLYSRTFQRRGRRPHLSHLLGSVPSVFPWETWPIWLRAASKSYVTNKFCTCSTIHHRVGYVCSRKAIKLSLMYQRFQFNNHAPNGVNREDADVTLQTQHCPHTHLQRVVWFKLNTIPKKRDRTYM